MVKQLCESAGVAVERRFPSGKWTAIERRSEQFRFVWFPQFEYVQAEPAEHSEPAEPSKQFGVFLQL